MDWKLVNWEGDHCHHGIESTGAKEVSLCLGGGGLLLDVHERRVLLPGELKTGCEQLDPPFEAKVSSLFLVFFLFLLAVAWGGGK